MSPKALNEWFLIVYADAYEWVEMPNVSGMVLFADGGLFASKPYAAGGNYINKMSNYCKNCIYDVKQKTGEKACPFNYLYWNFIGKHKKKFEKNPRMSMIYNTFSKMPLEQKKNIALESEAFFEKLDKQEYI